MSRISSRSFAVNSSQQQIVELGSIGEVEIDVVQSDRSLLNCNASIQLAGADIDDTNQVPVKNTNSSDMEVNSNLRINSLDVDDTNRVPCKSNLQVYGLDVSGSNKVPVKNTARSDMEVNSNLRINAADVDDTNRVPTQSNLQIGGVDVSGSNQVPVTITGGVSGSEANLDNGSSVIADDNSTAVNVNSDKHNIFGNSTDTTNAIEVEISANGTDYYNMGIDIFPNGSGDFQLSLDMPIQYIRLRYTGTATVTATVISS